MKSARRRALPTAFFNGFGSIGTAEIYRRSSLSDHIDRTDEQHPYGDRKWAQAKSCKDMARTKSALHRRRSRS